MFTHNQLWHQYVHIGKEEEGPLKQGASIPDASLALANKQSLPMPQRKYQKNDLTQDQTLH